MQKIYTIAETVQTPAKAHALILKKVKKNSSWCLSADDMSSAHTEITHMESVSCPEA